MKPIMKEFPYSFDTERLTIRGPLPGDGLELWTAVTESQAELKPWLVWAVDLPDADWYEGYVRQGQLKFLGREDLLLLLFLKGTNTIIGGSGLHRMDWDVPKFEIGYWVRTSYAGQGYITEAVTGITNFAFDKLDAKRVEIRCDVKNAKSAAIPRRLGFDLEATIRCDTRDHITNELRDTYIFSKIRRDG